MKQAVFFIVLVVAVAGGGVFWLKHRAEAPATQGGSAEAKPAEEAEGPKVTRDARGNVVIALSSEAQEKLGIQATNPAAFRMSPEAKGYGRVLDAAPLAAAVTELAALQAASVASGNELARLKTLEGQGNASTRALQAAEAAAQRDQLAVQSAKAHLLLAWGKAIADRADLPAFVQALAAQEAALVRIDLPVGESPATPAGARVVTASGTVLEAGFLGPAPNVDPQMQGRGYFVLVKSDASRLAAGETVVGYLKLPLEPLSGVIVPRDAVVRTESAGWVYVLDAKNGATLTRTEVALDRPTDGGWFVTNGATSADRVVVAGAQQLLSIELKGGGAE